MASDVLLFAPQAISECIRRNFSSSDVQEDGEQEQIRVKIPKSLLLPEGVTIVVDTAVSQQQLIHVISCIAQNRMYAGEGSQLLRTCAPLKDWHIVRRAQYNREHGSCSRAILEYLNDPNERTRTVVRKLGLAPDQEELWDLQYFRAIPPDQIQPGGAQRYSAEYSAVHKILVDEFLQRERSLVEAARKQGDSALSDTILSCLRRRVIGQEMALQAVAPYLQANGSQQNKVFLFVGPTGIGKTELAKAMGQVKGRFVSFQMEKYQMEDDAAMFTGAPTGYIGSTDLPCFFKSIVTTLQLTPSDSDVYTVSDAVILFDELGKAHTTVRSALLEIFADGQHVVQYTRSSPLSSISTNVQVQFVFQGCIFVGTSNLFQDQILEAFRRQEDIASITSAFKGWSAKAVSGALRSSTGEIPFTREVLGRMAIFPFGPILRGEDGYRAVVKTKYAAWLAILNEDFASRCAGVVMESQDRAELAAFIERTHYGNGTDMRGIVIVLDKLRAALFCMRGLALTKSVKLWLTCRDDAVFVQGFIMNDVLSIREPIGDPLLIYSP